MPGPPALVMPLAIYMFGNETIKDFLYATLINLGWYDLSNMSVHPDLTWSWEPLHKATIKATLDALLKLLNAIWKVQKPSDNYSKFSLPKDIFKSFSIGYYSYPSSINVGRLNQALGYGGGRLNGTFLFSWMLVGIFFRDVENTHGLAMLEVISETMSASLSDIMIRYYSGTVSGLWVNLLQGVMEHMTMWPENFWRKTMLMFLDIGQLGHQICIAFGGVVGGWDSLWVWVGFAFSPFGYNGLTCITI
ncbi:hypothetical protein HYDPIDRAFT_169732 [Hydnomerulius pinastri MD-312]|uniref:Uncharacterized protein n=1 Tax=Hydnomerulius pinastri MD-312 TaxID=994086 RepID=A0A0C9WCB5_9AGAM|nr:hypothetical protein HYDPIDRAFT_169732 [Hydnomerulius pinastri MD-312]